MKPFFIKRLSGTMTDTFYRDFEAQFRGNRSIIIERLRVYEPFIAPLALQSGDAVAIDLGCGRGEWLEILSHAGFSARGVDLDEGMLAVAREKRLAVEQMDALTALRAIPSGALAVVSAFHLIEHLSFDVVLEILIEARRTLRPGGIIILETPNPENPIVSLVNFHLDPTHVRPLPPALTSFAAEHVGFYRTVTLRLQGANPRVETASELYSLLTDISLDYAVIAQVEGPRANDLDQAFSLRLGMDIHSGVRRFDEANKVHIRNVNKLLLDQQKITATWERSLDQQKITATWERSWIERLFFRPSNGRPIQAIRLLLFHKSGKPRGIFRKWVLKPDGRPRHAFKQWMNGTDYLALPWPVNQRMDVALEPEESIIAFDPHRPRSTGLPDNMMTLEELVAKADHSSSDGR